MEDEVKRKIILAGLGVLIILGIVLAAVGFSGNEDAATESVPLSETSKPDGDPTYLASEGLYISVDPPGFEPEQPTEEPDSDPAPSNPNPINPVTPTPTVPPNPSTPPPPPDPDPPPPPDLGGGGGGSSFAFSPYDRQMQTIGEESTLASHGWWRLGTVANTAGASTIKVDAVLNNEPSAGSYYLAVWMKFTGSEDSIYMGLQTDVWRLNGNRGAVFKANGSQELESPSGISGSFNGGHEAARLIDWYPGGVYTYTVQKDVGRSDAQNTWWNAYVKTPEGSELLIGSARMLSSAGNPKVRSTYIERYGLPKHGCGSTAPLSARFSNLRNDGIGPNGVSPAIRRYTDCNDVYQVSAFGNSGYTVQIKSGSN